MICKSPFLDNRDRIFENSIGFVIYDSYPVNKGHCLIIPHRIYPDYFDSNEEEIKGLNELLFKTKKFLKDQFDPDGFNVGINCGQSAGQTVMHMHIHLIPRYKGDVEQPAGGVRGVIPLMQKYSMSELTLKKLYSREEVHRIFSPDTNFTPGAGYWGIQGVISLSDRKGDYIFFVTYGSSQAKHEFDEAITSEGVLSWQSQPSKKLSDKSIQELIHHNEKNNNIFLFLRHRKGDDYQYLGLLKYLSHDNLREKPVYFQWQLIDWNLR